MRYANFEAALDVLRDRMRSAQLVHTEKWQGLDISKRPEAAMHELVNVSLTVPMTPQEKLAELVEQVKPNLPWADMHFEERVCGEPLNPPPSWKLWPWANSAGNFLDARGQFNHTYPERFWPKWAGQTVDGKLLSEEHMGSQNPGIRYVLGDLNDLVSLLAREPLTRQAYLPIFFPEDTGAVHGDRVPCTLGYHFMRRNDRLHCWYFIRSCEFVRHFRDDIYLAVRLVHWVLDRLIVKDPDRWLRVMPGDFTMHICSLHMFRNDHIAEFGG